jgi:hypothetical protein
MKKGSLYRLIFWKTIWQYMANTTCTCKDTQAHVPTEMQLISRNPSLDSSWLFFFLFFQIWEELTKNQRIPSNGGLGKYLCHRHKVGEQMLYISNNRLAKLTDILHCPMKCCDSQESLRRSAHLCSKNPPPYCPRLSHLTANTYLCQLYLN